MLEVDQATGSTSLFEVNGATRSTSLFKMCCCMSVSHCHLKANRLNDTSLLTYVYIFHRRCYLMLLLLVLKKLLSECAVNVQFKTADSLKSFSGFIFPAVSLEPVMAAHEARMLPLCYAVPPPPPKKKKKTYKKKKKKLVFVQDHP